MLLKNIFQRTRNNMMAIFICLLVIIPVYVVVVNSLKTRLRPAR